MPRLAALESKPQQGMLHLTCGATEGIPTSRMCDGIDLVKKECISGLGETQAQSPFPVYVPLWEIL